MSNVFFISDLHLGHKGILKFAGEWRGGTTVEEHDDWLVTMWNSVIGKRDLVYVLGDVAFTPQGLSRLGEMRGTKLLVRGNHDKFRIGEYLKYFHDIFGFRMYKNMWLSHAPIHPTELRGRVNVHGHVHHNTIPDPRYFNVCVEPLAGIPIRFDELIKKIHYSNKENDI